MRGSGVHRPAGHPTLCDPSLRPSGGRGLGAGLVLQAPRPPQKKKPAQAKGEVGPKHPRRPRACVAPLSAPPRPPAPASSLHGGGGGGARKGGAGLELCDCCCAPAAGHRVSPAPSPVASGRAGRPGHPVPSSRGFVSWPRRSSWKPRTWAPAGMQTSGLLRPPDSYF